MLALTGVELYTDAALTTPGLRGSYVNRSLRHVSSPADWRTTQPIAGTRVDAALSFLTDGWGSRAAVGLTKGSDADWHDFSVQWDGYLKVTQAGQRVGTTADDGARMWIDLNGDGAFGPSELLDNGWGRDHGAEGGDRSPGLAAGAYRVRVQYYDSGAGNLLSLHSSPFVPRQFVPTPTNPRQVVRAIVLNYDPRVPSEGGKRIHEVFNWSDARKLAAEFEKDVEWASGGAVDLQVVEWRDLDAFPTLVDGYRYTPDEYAANWRAGGGWHASPTDFYRLAEDQGLAELVNGGAIDEIWAFGPPGGMDLFGEAWMAGPESFFINGPSFHEAPFDRAVAGYGFSLERGVAEMLHNLGHRTENHGGRAYDYTWNLANPTSTWDRFTANVLESPGGYPYGVGTAHVPANATGHYDYGNAQVVQSTALDWVNYPNLTGATTPVGRANWEFGPFADHHRDYFNFFYGLMPRAGGVGPDGRQANWYKYIYDFNAYEPVTGAPRQQTAVLSAPPPAAPGVAAAAYTFTVRYYDADGVNTAMLGAGDVRVTGPAGYDQVASLVKLVPGHDPRQVTAVYGVPVPGGSWDRTDQGTYTFALQASQVRDLAGTAFAATELGQVPLTFKERTAIDVNGLVATGQATVTGTQPDIGTFADLFDQRGETLYRTPQVNPAVIQVAFATAQAVSAFRFLGASGASPAYRLRIETADTAADLANRTGSYRELFAAAEVANRAVAVLSLPSPVTAKVVKLTATQLNGDGYIHLYDYTLIGPPPADATAPTAALPAPPAAVTTGGGRVVFVDVAYADPSGVAALSIDSTDLLVTGPGGFSAAPTFYDVSHHADGPARTGTYWFAPPGGQWDHADNGTYTITLSPGRVRDVWGNAAGSAVTLGTFLVDVPPPERRPPPDLAEQNAGRWAGGAQDGTASTSDDAARKLLGASSVKFVTNGAFDTWARFPADRAADWDLTAAANVYFSVFAENANDFGFQESSPWIRVTDAAGNYSDYRLYQNGDPVNPLNDARGQWKSFVVPLRASETTTNGWRRTAFGDVDLARVASVEFHADTWGGGFTLWYDRVGFDLPVAVTSAALAVDEPRQALRFTFDADVGGTLGVADVRITDVATGAVVPAANLRLAYDAVTRTATVTFANYPGNALPAGDYRASFAAGGVADVAGNGLAAGAGLDFFALPGDANRDRRVDFADLVRLAQNYDGVGKTFSQGDFNYDGAVDFADLVVLAQRYDTGLGDPPAAADGVAFAAAWASLTAAPTSATTPAPAPGKPQPKAAAEKSVNTVFSTTPVAKAKPAAAKPKAAAAAAARPQRR
jgi:hypothetical protein